MTGNPLHTDEARAKRAKTLAESAQEKINKAIKGLEPVRRRMIEENALEMPKVNVSVYLRAVRGKSRPAAIKAFCMECVGWQRREVALCTSLACPLYPYRPFKE